MPEKGLEDDGKKGAEEEGGKERCKERHTALSIVLPIITPACNSPLSLFCLPNEGFELVMKGSTYQSYFVET